MNQKKRLLRSWHLMLFLFFFSPARLFAQYDIYTYDIKKGTTSQATHLAQGSAFNASWSNNGKKIAHDVLGSLAYPFDQSIFITNIETGTTLPLAGAEGGNDPAWSPNGQTIAFDDYHIYPYSIYSVPANGGTRSILRYNAHHASWNPNGNKIAFDDNYGYIGTRDINTGNETFVTYYGTRPAWSPDGKYIAFDGASWIGGGVWIVEIDTLGYPQLWPVQLTTSGYGATWKNNSKEIVFVDWPNGEPDIYSIAVTGGMATKLCGRSGGFDKGDYDPSYSNNGQFVAWSSYTDGVVTETNKAMPENNNVKKISAPAFVLEQNYPNPFDNTTKIKFHLVKNSRISLTVVDLLGRNIKTLIDADYSTGSYSVSWDGRDTNNNEVANGLYLYVLKAEDKVQVKRMNIIRQ